MISISWGQINDIVAGFACADRRYREALLSDPKRILSAQLGQRLPDFLDVQVLVESADTIYLVLPHQVGDGAEVSDADLDAVSGGCRRSPLRSGGGGGGETGGMGGDGGDGADAGFQCQTYGGGHMGTHHDIDTAMSIF